PRSLLIDVPRLLAGYYTLHPEPGASSQAVSFGTSGHRGTSLEQTFNEDHIAAICQAVVDLRAAQGISGPLFLGADTHALSTPALITALEVLSANQVDVVVAANAGSGEGFDPAP